MAVDGWSAVILTGGASRRMGRDKALLPVAGVAMAQRVAAALRAAGADDITCVGGDLEGLRALGLSAIEDEWPGAGPVAGLLTGLDHATHDVVVVTACDLIAPDAVAFTALVEAMHESGVVAALPVVDGRDQPAPAALRREAMATVRAAFDAGERAMHPTLRRLDPVRIVLDSAATADADTPGDLPADR
jgi:molybdopterin-guanine dinucleotide biosynthesis protein A